MSHLDIDPTLRGLLDRCLTGHRPTWEEGVRLCQTQGAELAALVAVADTLRREQVGDTVTYVVNRNINFTNVCVKACRFCAFSRTQRSGEGYFLGLDEVVERAREARAFGATEVCIQAGLAPGMSGEFYLDICRAIKAAVPDLHLHAFSPEEIKYGAGLLKWPVSRFLAALKDAGLGSLPGTSAEVLDDAVRDRLAPGRIRSAEWMDLIETAHRLGIPTTATLMYGHIESDAERMQHLAMLRSIQQATGGFTEFVPLSFVHEEAPMFRKEMVASLRPGPTQTEVMRLYAIARLMLGRDIPHLQVSWVKDGLELGQQLLQCGANDLGGTLINESISTAAGASHGQLVPPARLRQVIRGIGREPAERSTLYRVLRRFPLAPGPGDTDPVEPLDTIADAEARFGSYARLIRDEQVRFKRPVKATGADTTPALSTVKP